MYISILSIPLRSPPATDPQTIECMLHCQDHQSTIRLFKLEGGQRFLVPEEDMFAIIDSLWAGETVTIKLGRYEGVLVCDNFRNAYRKLLSNSSCAVTVHWSSFSLR